MKKQISDKTAEPSAKEENIFLLTNLPAASDYVLRRSMIEYRHAHAILTGLPQGIADVIEQQLQEALFVIENELQTRCLPQ